MTAPLTPLVASLPATVPFVGPEKQERDRGRLFAARIGANESVFGPSPLAIEAMQQAAPEMWKYCDPNNHDLRQALAAHHGVPPESIVIGEGIDGLLGYTARLFLDRGWQIITCSRDDTPEECKRDPNWTIHIPTDLGEADLGRVVGVGCAIDPDARAVADLRGVYDAADLQ